MADPIRVPALVVDASTALAIVRSEPHAPAVERVLADHRRVSGRFLVPDAIWLEIANVLGRRYHGTASEVVATLQDLDDLGLEDVRIERPLLLATIDIQARYGLSAYDAAYLALAEAEDARLLTLDERLAAAAGKRAARIEGWTPRRLAEEPATYESDPVDWARFGPYLARLRAEARSAAR